MLIFPAIDILDNRVGRLEQGDFKKVTYYDSSPFKIAEKFQKHGFKWVHIIDLSATLDGKINVLELLKEIKKNINLSIQFGGGIRSEKQIDKLLELNIDRVIIGSLSVQKKETFENIIKKYGPTKFAVAVDSMDEKIFVKGWTENSGVSIYDHVEYCKDLGIEYFLSTDISKDGMLEGPNFHMYGELMNKYPDIKLIASGGVSSIHDILQLRNIDLHAAVVGKALYEQKIRIEDLAKIGF